MIDFKDIEYKNILAVGNVPHYIDFKKTNQCLMVGKNGSGKSTLLDALIFVLYGKAFRKIRLEQLVNAINGANLLVTLNFTIGNSDYKIVRGIKADIFEIWINGKLKNQMAAKKDYQKFLENNILKMTESTFRQIVILGSSSYVPFMRLNPGQRREIIENLLDIQVYGVMNVLLKNRGYYLAQEYRDIISNLKLLENESRLTKTHIDQLEQQSNETNERTDEKIATVRTEINVLLERVNNILQEIDNIPKEKEDLEIVELHLKDLNILRTRINSNLVSNKKSLKFFSDNDSCPTCEQAIDETLKAEKIESHNVNVDKFSVGIEKMKESIRKSELQIDEMENRLKTIARLNRSMESTNHDIANKRDHISILQNEKEVKSDFIDLDKDKAHLLKIDDDIAISTKKRNELSEVGKYYSAIVDMLKDSGIKKAIIRSYLPMINKLVRKYLDILEFNVDFRFNETFNEVMKSRHRDKFSYDNFSEGEKMRIDLALLFVWRELARRRNSAATNLLIMDEIGDSSLDGDGFEAFMKIIGEDISQQNVFIISHKVDIMSDKFTNIYYFEKKNNFSELNA